MPNYYPALFTKLSAPARARTLSFIILSRRSRNQKGVRRLSKNHPRLSGQCWMIRRFTSAQIVPATRVHG